MSLRLVLHDGVFDGMVLRWTGDGATTPLEMAFTTWSEPERQVTHKYQAVDFEEVGNAMYQHYEYAGSTSVAATVPDAIKEAWDKQSQGE